MDFTPHTDADLAVMMDRLGIEGLDELFEHLPDAVLSRTAHIGEPLSELEVQRLVDGWGDLNQALTCFAGGGFYDHFLPPVVQHLTSRPEFVTAYTPYQPEVSQGVLQGLYEYQSMICAITGMDVANSSMYDGATATVEAINAAVLATRRNAVWISRGVGPRIREAVATFATARGFDVVEHPLVDGQTAWATDAEGEPAAVVMAQPNYLGVIEAYDTPIAMAHELGALAVVSVDPMTLGVLRSPGDADADIVVGEGQALGSPLSFGGPGLGIFALKQAQVRRLPGRIVGRTVDRDGTTAYVMTLRAREQDIRRQKASSNICSNQALNAMAAGIHLAWLGPDGLQRVGELSARKAHYLAARLRDIPEVRLAVDAPFVREFPILLPEEPAAVVQAMAERGYLAGIPLDEDYPEFPGGLLVAVTEKRTKDEMDGYVEALKEVLAHA